MMIPSAVMPGPPPRIDDLGAAGTVRHCAATGLLSAHLGFGGWLRLSVPVRAHWTEVDRATQVLHGRISGHATPVGRVVAWMARLAGCPFGPVNRADVPVTVRIRLGADRLQLHWRRCYAIPGRRAMVVRSIMSALPDGRFAEVFPRGLGVTLALDEVDGSLRFTSTGFVWRVFGRHLPIPHWLGPGRLTVVEGCDADGQHSIGLTLTHPWFGVVYRLSGTYRAIADIALRPDAISVGPRPGTDEGDDRDRSSTSADSPSDAPVQGGPRLREDDASADETQESEDQSRHVREGGHLLPHRTAFGQTLTHSRSHDLALAGCSPDFVCPKISVSTESPD